MRKEPTILCLACLLALSLLALPGCVERGLEAGGDEVWKQVLSFSRVPCELEVKKMEVDGRGVLWILTYGDEMYTLDPDLFLAELTACGGGVKDFALEGMGLREGLAGGYVYLATGQSGLLRMDGSGSLTPDYEGDVMVSVHADHRGGMLAGGAGGLYALEGGAWEKAWGTSGETPAMPVKMARAEEGVLCEIWENRLELVVPGEAESQPMQVPDKKNVRVVDLLEMLSGEVFLVTTQGVYRLEGRELVMVKWSEDPIISSSRIGRGDILLGKNSGALTRLEPFTGEEEFLGSLDGPVRRVGSSAEGLVYAQGESDLYFSRDLAGVPERLVSRAGYGVDTGTRMPAGIRLALPVSDLLAPEWFYFEVSTGAGGLSWELEDEGSGGLFLDLRGASGGAEVDTLVAAPPTDTFSFAPGDRYPFPESFPEEVRPYLQPMAGAPPDLPEVSAVLEAVPAEVKEDMLELLLCLTRNGVFYETACAGGAEPPRLADGPRSEEYVREAVTRVLSGGKGDDYARALAFTALCRGAGIPCRTALSFDHYLNQAYLCGEGWVAVDVSHPVFDLLAPSYPAVGSLPGGAGSFITGTGGVDDGLAYAEVYEVGDASGTDGDAGASTVIFCQPSSFRLRDTSEAIALPGGTSFHFEERGGDILLVRNTAQGREEEPIYQDYDSLTLEEGLEVSLYLVGRRYVVVEASREFFRASWENPVVDLVRLFAVL